jgi:hypothetical protein
LASQFAMVAADMPRARIAKGNISEISQPEDRPESDREAADIGGQAGGR